MADIKISQMTAGTPDENTLFEGSLDGGGGVYNTRSVSASALATLLNTTMQYGGLSTTDDTIVGSINEVAKDHNASDEYDSTQTYVVGDLCIYGNNLYECNTDISTPEAFDANKWTQTTLDAVIPRDIEDLNNVTLTTSDNNKLLGVSVVGGDISVGAVDKHDVSIGSITASTGATVRSAYVTKIDGIVYARFAINVTNTFSSRTTIGNFASGFRPSATISYIVPASTGINDLANRSVSCLIGANGDIIVGDYCSSGSVKEVTALIAFPVTVT